ncbi:MAG: polyhydroxyalkanoate synthesis regulator [Armatimonadota bacterium]|nr:polyhydroxyalkanoate synthesis regulator [Armatimonadota bacterium]
MKMLDVLKKTLAFGLGAAAFSAEKLKQLADEMVSRGEMTSEEARKFVEEMTKKADEEKRTVQEWIREQVSKVLQQAGAVDSARVEALEKRVAAIEEKLGTTQSERQCEAESQGDG